MPGRLTALAIAALAMLGIAACGGGENDAFEEEFPTELGMPIIRRG